MPTQLPLTITLNGSREDVRQQIAHVFLKEQPGTGTANNASRYHYTVENLLHGRSVYLKRPSRVGGFDFEVHVTQTQFALSRIKSRPKHEDILQDLRAKQLENSKEFQKVSNCLQAIYLCRDVPDTYTRSIAFQSGHPVEMILKVVKWLFIEQDITYWNYSGRAMFYNAIQSRCP